MSDNYDSGFDLVLTDYERGYLTAFFDHVILDLISDGTDDDWHGVQVGGRMFDFNTWHDDETGELICTIYECDRVRDNWQTNCRHSWVIKEG